jgi:glycolate oxidase iron-sulfur subunit
MDGRGLDAIVIRRRLRHHDQGLRLHVPRGPGYAEKARRVSEMSKDVTEYMLTLKLMAPVRESDLVGRLPLGLLHAARQQIRTSRRRS